MPAATSQRELLEVTTQEFTKLTSVIEPLDDAIAVAKDDDDTSVKDLVAHRAHWIELFLGWYRDGLAGRTVHFPAEGYKWNELPRYNADLRAAQAGLGWSEACEQLHIAHHELLAFIEDHDDTDLYGGPMVGARNAWTPGRWAEAAGPSHYRSATKEIRRRLRSMTT